MRRAHSFYDYKFLNFNSPPKSRATHISPKFITTNGNKMNVQYNDSTDQNSFKNYLQLDDCHLQKQSEKV